MHSVFTYQLRGETLYADAVKIRRILLNKTDGRAWTYIRDLAIEKEQGEKLRNTQDDTPQDQLEAKLAINRVNVSHLEGILAAATIEAFEFPPFDPQTGDGVTEMDALTVLQQYMDFAAGKG